MPTDLKSHVVIASEAKQSRLAEALAHLQWVPEASRIRTLARLS